MIFKQYYLGCLAHASYLVADEITRTAAVIDQMRTLLPGYEIRPLKDCLGVTFRVKNPALSWLMTPLLALNKPL